MSASVATVELSDEQEAAVDHLLAFPSLVQTLGGYAGTGKTTIIKTLAAAKPSFAVCAYTGKAANVLRGKGVQASTIHSLIYRPVEERYHDANGVLRTRTRFERKHGIEVGACGFIVDEASMVSQAIHDDLRSYGRPIIFVGDHGQLEPVNDRFNLMKTPDVTLEKIHRNAGEIARFAEHLRKGGEPARWRSGQGEQRVELRTRDNIGDDWMQADQVITARNSTRVSLNRVRRAALGYPEDRPVPGDRVICLQNDRLSGLFNGMQGTITQIRNSWFLFESQGRRYDVQTNLAHFNCEKPELEFGRGTISFDYAYAITCHKAQGDEWDHVVAFEERLPFLDHARWTYTAASRARKQLTWVSP
jgi:ATP-dependent exoDNAse (exonuclease V) alpha subunit